MTDLTERIRERLEVDEHTEPAARKAVVAVLRELAAKPDGYLRSTKDGGITYTRTLRGLADEVEAGEAKP